MITKAEADRMANEMLAKNGEEKLQAQIDLLLAGLVKCIDAIETLKKRIDAQHSRINEMEGKGL